MAGSDLTTPLPGLAPGMALADVIFNRITQIDAICEVVAAVDAKSAALSDAALREVMSAVQDLASSANKALIELQEVHRSCLMAAEKSCSGGSDGRTH